MNTKWKYVLSATIPLGISVAIATGISRLPYGRELGRTLVMVSGSSVANRILTAAINPDVKGWKYANSRYSTQVTLSTGVGITSSLIGSAYDSASYERGGINLAIATLGGWSVGNLLWLGDALVLGEDTALQPGDFLPELHI